MSNQPIHSREANAGTLRSILRLAAMHLIMLILSLFLFDLAVVREDFDLAPLVIIVTGLVAGFLVVNLAHEWCHYVGARATSSHYSVRDKLGMFLFDWDFDANSTRHFLVMSIAGNVGGALALMVVVATAPALDIARASYIAGAAASFALGAFIEWPVIMRTLRSGNPFAELSRLSPVVLVSSLVGSVAVGAVAWQVA
ncbi:hypothetical protein A3709_02055 [Halioglobus sp. HI00S01]|uniref:hypothetical protein n=1 Tax=Halioglobus sp. HI00S01 TaxID=1822214 RepID=UPI0007C38239|nr:hypothetical protein [Halioglobus sp. HI00S01]KZX58270.1 hypothetical protein A3709_02055 [Halioglobus sp. HI00S01]